MYHFCTYFDSNFLDRGLALFQSLKRFCPDFQLFVLCLDDSCYKILQQFKLPQMNLIKLQDFEKNDPELQGAKNNRTRVEYFFTCTPSLPLYVLKNYRKVDVITYLDADLLCFANPEPIYKEFAQHSIAIISHRFPIKLKQLERRGIYNVGYLSFKRDKYALECLNWWRQNCIEWCYDRVEDSRYADQKYLDDWPTRFKGVVVLQHKGVNLAPWNLDNYQIESNDKGIWVDEQPLVFFHFHGLRKIYKRLYDPNLYRYNARISKKIKNSIFVPYINALSEVNQKYLSQSYESANLNGIRDALESASIHRKLWQKLDRILYNFRILIAGNYIWVKRPIVEQILRATPALLKSRNKQE